MFDGQLGVVFEVRLGVPVIEWNGDVSLQAALEEGRRFKRHARVARA